MLSMEILFVDGFDAEILEMLCITYFKSVTNLYFNMGVYHSLSYERYYKCLIWFAPGSGLNLLHLSDKRGELVTICG